MYQLTKTSFRQQQMSLPPLLTLALWQARQTWRLLLLIGIGMVAAVVLVCAVPLYTQMATTAGLRTLLTASPGNTAITIQSSSQRPLSSTISDIGQKLKQEIQGDIGPYLSPASQLSLTTNGLSFHTLNPHAEGNEIALIGSSMSQAAPHLQAVQGRLPLPLSKTIEIAVTAQAASHLHLHVGQLISMSLFYQTSPKATQGQIEHDLHLSIVGIFQPKDTDVFWHQTDFATTPLYTPDGRMFTYFSALMSNQTFLTVMDSLATDLAATRFPFSPQADPLLENAVTISWYYSLDPSHIDASHLDDLLQRLNMLLVHISGSTDSSFVRVPVVEFTAVTATTVPLLAYQNRLTVLNVPVSSLTLLVTALILFFVSVMMSVLIDRYADTIAILQSRGANRRQIFGIMLTQTIILGLIALLVSPFLALAVVSLLARSILHDQGALDVLPNTPVRTFAELSVLLVLTSGVVILATLPAIIHASQMNVLTRRREIARSTHLPLWVRMNVDMLVAALALLSYAFTRYVTTPGVLDTHVYILILSPLMLIGTTFLVLGCALLFLRVFPFLLRLAGRLAQGSRSVTFLLSLVQLARTSRPVGRIILLLALAISFGMFTLVFTASQQQRIADVAAYQTGADFSGTLPTDAPSFPSIAAQTAAYNHIPGVISATVGYTALATAFGNEQGIPIALKAVDATTFAQTGLWTNETSSPSLTSLMKQLLSSRAAIATDAVPAIVDEAAWEQLHLQIGLPFLLNDGSGTVKFIPIRRVEYIPPIYDSVASPTDSFAPVGGVLVDYQTYATVFHDSNRALEPIKTTQVWLRTASHPAPLVSVRKALNTGRLKLENLTDRRAMLDVLSNDPLYQTLKGLLILGASTALLLALIGSMITSWLSARTQLTQFALLRAMGSTPRQWTQILLCEQSVVYLAAIAQGLLFGLILSLLALPTLIFSSVNTPGSNSVLSSRDFYMLQTIPPVHIVFPSSVGFALVVVLILCILALSLMMWIISTPSTSQILRLNED